MVKIYAAADSRIEVEPGTRVTGAASVLMNFVHETPVSAISDTESREDESGESDARGAPAGPD